MKWSDYRNKMDSWKDYKQIKEIGKFKNRAHFQIINKFRFIAFQSYFIIFLGLIFRILIIF